MSKLISMVSLVAASVKDFCEAHPGQRMGEEILCEIVRSSLDLDDSAVKYLPHTLRFLVETELSATHNGPSQGPGNGGYGFGAKVSLVIPAETEAEILANVETVLCSDCGKPQISMILARLESMGIKANAKTLTAWFENRGFAVVRGKVQYGNPVAGTKAA